MFAKFRSSMFLRIFATTTAVIVVLFGAMYLLAVPFIQATVEGIEERSGRTILDNVYEMAAQTRSDLDAYRQSVVLERKALLRDVVAMATARARQMETRVNAGAIAAKEARRQLLDELRQFKYGNGDYVWAADYRSVLMSHPDPALNGADFSATTDLRGSLIMPPLLAGARLAGEAYHSYWWRRLGEQQPLEKLSYCRDVPAFELVICSGVYLDDVEAAVLRKQALAIDGLRERLRNTHIAKTGYVFVFDGQMKMVIHPNANVESKEVGHLLDNATKTPLFPMLMAAADKPEAVHYKWDSPADPGNYVHDKISWVRYFADLDWYIGSSVYVDELAASARTLRNRVLAVFALTLLLAIALLHVFVKKLTDPLRQLRNTALRVESGDLDARCELDRSDEIGVVASAFNGMVVQLQHNIRHLDAKVLARTAELETANRELKELDQLKSAFLSTVSHELRTPTTSIVGFVKLVSKKLEKSVFPRAGGDDASLRAIAQVRSNLDVIVGESERLTLLIDDVLDSAKLDAGEAEWAFAALAPPQLVERGSAVMAALAEQKGLALHSAVEPNLPDVRGDRNRLLQVLTNLIANAVKFTERGQIEVRAERQDGCVRFSVSDSGIGIAAENRQKVFDKFRQVGDTLTDKPQGPGLGLSICRQIVRHHGGEIWLESTLGAGSTFYFTVPLCAPGPPQPMDPGVAGAAAEIPNTL